MFVALYNYEDSFQMFSYETSQEAINEIEKHFDELIKSNDFDPNFDEAVVFEEIGNGKEMKQIYSTRELIKYSA